MSSWTERWVQLRKKELMAYPKEFPIHDVYKAICTQEELTNGFTGLHEIFMQCYADILNNPVEMRLPAYDMNAYGYFSKEARLSREGSYQYAKIFYVLGYTGELCANGELCIQADELKAQCKSLKISNISAFLNILSGYGIVVEGLIKGKIKSNTAIAVSFPDNKNVIAALYALAVKANHTNRFKDFCRLNYKLFESDWDTIEYGGGVDAVSDLFHSEQDRAAAERIHAELIRRNYFYNFQDWNEGPQIRYYKKEGDRNRNANAGFWLASMDAEFRFYFRIRNMDKILPYIQTCPEHVIHNFMVSDDGCANRSLGTCVSGISYRLNDQIVWRCGCCNPNFQVTPSVEDYIYYINAVDMAGGN